MVQKKSNTAQANHGLRRTTVTPMLTATEQFEALYQEIPKQQVDFQLKGLEKSIEMQMRSLDDYGMLNLNFRDPMEAKIVGESISRLFPNPTRARLGIMELFLNAIEHGNLNIHSEEKYRLFREGKWMQEITKRLQNRNYSNRRVHTYLCCTDDYVELTIRDEGDGFNWQKHFDTKPKLIKEVSGRGIATARHICFDGLRYSNLGNEVKARQFVNQ